MSEQRSQNYLHGAAILTLSVIIIKILGAIYKIPLYSILGTDGTTDFTVAYNIYNVLLTLSTAGLPVALSRMISESNTLGKSRQVTRNFNVALTAFLVLGSIGTIVMFLFPVELAAAMSEVEAAQSIKALSPAVLLVCLMSAYRGYTQGHADMRPTSMSQVIEVAVKVVFGLVIAWLLTKAGKSTPLVSAGAIAGVGVGSLIALIYLFFCKRKIDLRWAKERDMRDKPETVPKTLGKLVYIGIPIALGSSVLTLMTLLDTAMSMGILKNTLNLQLGAAKALFGEYQYTITMYNFPAAFIMPFTISIIPAITACVAKKQHGEARDITESSLRMSTLISLPMGVGLSVLAYPIMNVIFKDVTEIGPPMLGIMGIASYLVCMAMMTTAILQAHGKERLPFYSMLVGAAVKIALNWILISIPDINISGAAIGTLGCYVVMCGINLIFIQSVLVKKLRLSRIIVLPLIASAAMGGVSFVIYGLLRNLLSDGAELTRITMAVSMLAAIGIGVIVYVVLAIVTRAITMEDMKLIPKGEKLAKLLKIR